MDETLIVCSVFLNAHPAYFISYLLRGVNTNVVLLLTSWLLFIFTSSIDKEDNR